MRRALFFLFTSCHSRGSTPFETIMSVVQHCDGPCDPSNAKP